jgi:hypothetical protein
MTNPASGGPDVRGLRVLDAFVLGPGKQDYGTGNCGCNKE